MVVLFPHRQSTNFILTHRRTQLETAIGAVSRTKSFEATTTSENLPTETHIPPSSWPSTGRVDIRSLAITYKPESGQNVIEDFNLTISPGEKIGICGRSGSGKSSLVLALFRMIEISAGSIHIDNVDISTLPRQDVRTRNSARSLFLVWDHSLKSRSVGHADG
jgi:ATP-binding cassette, subfamily C (CFTR/MRP), member 1